MKLFKTSFLICLFNFNKKNGRSQLNKYLVRGSLFMLHDLHVKLHVNTGI